jgi:hypothetical protein
MRTEVWNINEPGLGKSITYLGQSGRNIPLSETEIPSESI